MPGGWLYAELAPPAQRWSGNRTATAAAQSGNPDLLGVTRLSTWPIINAIARCAGKLFTPRDQSHARHMVEEAQKGSGCRWIDTGSGMPSPRENPGKLNVNLPVAIQPRSLAGSNCSGSLQLVCTGAYCRRNSKGLLHIGGGHDAWLLWEVPVNLSPPDPHEDRRQETASGSWPRSESPRSSSDFQSQVAKQKVLVEFLHHRVKKGRK